MDRLTREEIERARRTRNVDDCLEALCDLALQSRSQEAVRDEALEEALRFYAGEVDGQHWGEAMLEDGGRRAKAALVALKPEPNAAAQAPLPARLGSDAKVDSRQVESATDASAYPAPAAPDVAEVLSDWRVVAEFFASRNWPDTKLGDAASRLHARLPALLAKLGQGWIPVKFNMTNYPVARYLGEWDTIDRKREDGKIFRFTLPPLPGASDD